MNGLPRKTTNRIDLSHSLFFSFEGTTYRGYKGDTLASALLANGVRVFGRSFKYHRPRGLLHAGIEEPNALVTIIRNGRRELNIPATRVELFDGLVAESQNRFPSLFFDIGAAAALAGKFLFAGFYYKTFMGPEIGLLKGTRFWMFCEKFIRRAAGLGTPDYRPEPPDFEQMNAFCDILIVGAGPAGIEAARATADSGKRVILCDYDPVPGGYANWSDENIDGMPAQDWLADAMAQIQAVPNIRVLPRTTVWGIYDGKICAALEQVGDHRQQTSPGEPRHRHWTIRADRIILATGATERPLVFPGNDKPGVMLASAAQRLAREFGTSPDGEIAIFTNNDSAYLAAASLHHSGSKIAVIIDMRSDMSSLALDCVKRIACRHFAGHAVTAARGIYGLKSIEIAPFNTASGRPGRSRKSIPVKWLLLSGGWSPLINLASQAGVNPAWDDETRSFLAVPETDDLKLVGAASGCFSLSRAVAQAKLAGLVAAGNKVPETGERSDTEREWSCQPDPCIEVIAPGKAFVDFQNDVTAADIRLAHREGFISSEHLKRYTTLGMATDQGKSSSMAAMAIMASLRGTSIGNVGTTRFRPPFAPVSIGSLAGDRVAEFAPERLTPMHDWHADNEAVMRPVGLWYRPFSYPQPGETERQAAVREADAVRRGAGMIDVSTLGKIAVQGPDAAQFLDHVYTNRFSTLPVAKARYGLMLRPDGIVLDDGTSWRLGDNDFLMTTTTANSGKVLQHLEFCRDVMFPALRVNLTSVTDQWAGIALAGPKSIQILQAVARKQKPARDNPAPMQIVRSKISEIEVVVCRLSFSGERAYEIYCGAGYGEELWEKLLVAGEPFGLRPYGLDALDILRIEKGHVTGTELDGRTTARDLNLGWALSRKKAFIGSALMERAGLNDPERNVLVGVRSLDGQSFSGGSHIVETLAGPNARLSIGHVTAACYSPARRQFIGLALVQNGMERIGSRLFVSDPLRGHTAPVEIISHHMFDPEGKRIDA